MADGEPNEVLHNTRETFGAGRTRTPSTMNSTSTVSPDGALNSGSTTPLPALISEHDVRDAYEDAVLASSSKNIQKPRIDNDLSDEELRRIYDDEEVDHFLTLFSSVGPCFVMLHTAE